MFNHTFIYHEPAEGLKYSINKILMGAPVFRMKPWVSILVESNDYFVPTFDQEIKIFFHTNIICPTFHIWRFIFRKAVIISGCPEQSFIKAAEHMPSRAVLVTECTIMNLIPCFLVYNPNLKKFTKLWMYLRISNEIYHQVLSNKHKIRSSLFKIVHWDRW